MSDIRELFSKESLVLQKQFVSLLDAFQHWLWKSEDKIDVKVGPSGGLLRQNYRKAISVANVLEYMNFFCNFFKNTIFESEVILEPQEIVNFLSSDDFKELIPFFDAKSLYIFLTIFYEVIELEQTCYPGLLFARGAEGSASSEEMKRKIASLISSLGYSHQRVISQNQRDARTGVLDSFCFSAGDLNNYDIELRFEVFEFTKTGSEVLIFLATWLEDDGTRLHYFNSDWPAHKMFDKMPTNSHGFFRAAVVEFSPFFFDPDRPQATALIPLNFEKNNTMNSLSYENKVKNPFQLYIAMEKAFVRNQQRKISPRR